MKRDKLRVRDGNKVEGIKHGWIGYAKQKYPLYDDYFHINLAQEDIEKMLLEYAAEYNAKKDKTE